MLIQTTYPHDVVCINFQIFEPSKGSYQQILIITNHFSGFAVAVTRQNNSRCLLQQFHNQLWYSRRVHSDQGANFDGNITRELCNFTGIKSSRTTPYNPMGNDMCVTFYRTLLHMFGTLPRMVQV